MPFPSWSTDKGAFHPGLLSAFISLIGIYPPGTYVELSDGRVGMVSGVGGIIDRPKVKITQLVDGTRLQEDDRYDIDLGTMDRNSLNVSQLLLNYLETGQ